MATSSPPNPPSQASLQNKTSPSKQSGRLSALRAKQLSLQTTLDTLTSERDSLATRTLSTSSQSTTSSTTSLSPTHLPSSQASAGDHDARTRARAAVDIANQKTKSHIKQLQQYNDLKDIGQQLMGLIAEKRGVRIVEVQREFGVEGDD